MSWMSSYHRLYPAQGIDTVKEYPSLPDLIDPCTGNGMPMQSPISQQL